MSICREIPPRLIAGLFVALLGATEARAQTFVQQTVASTTAGTGVTPTLSSAPTNGNVLVASIALFNSADSVSSISQTAVVWSRVGRANTNIDLEIWVGVVRASAGTAATILYAPSSGAAAVNVSEWNGLSGVSDGAVAFSNGATANNSLAFSPVTGAYSNTNANDLIYVASGSTRNATTGSLTAGYTALTQVGAGGISIGLSPGDLIVSGAGSQSCTFSYAAGISGIKAWETAIIGFEAGTPPPPPALSPQMAMVGVGN